MDTAEDHFRSLIEGELDRFGGKPYTAEQALGLPEDAIRSILRGNRKAGTSLNRAKAICDALGLEFHIGPKRKREPLSGFAEEAAALIERSIDGSPEALRQGYLPIPYNSSDQSHRGSTPIAISRAWLHDRCLTPDHLSFVVAPDDAMAPSIHPGELMLVDGSARPSTEVAITAFVHQGQLGCGWVVAPRPGKIVVLFERKYSTPLVLLEKEVAQFRSVGRLAARFDGLPHPWIGNDERAEILERAESMVDKAK